MNKKWFHDLRMLADDSRLELRANRCMLSGLFFWFVFVEHRIIYGRLISLWFIEGFNLCVESFIA